MNKIAFILGDTFLYWNSIILMLACAAAVCLFLFFYLRQRGNGLGAAILVPLAVVLSFLLSRGLHWCCRSDAYPDLKTALTDFTGGGYALAGVFAGCILAAALLRLVRVIRNLPMALDCMALAGCAGIGLGRLSCLYIGVEQGYLETSLLQAIFAGGLFLGLTVWYLAKQRKQSESCRDGDAAWLFLAFYGASQVLLDSTRCDSLFLPGISLASLTQLLGVVGLILSCIVFSVRLVKVRGFRRQYVPVWFGFAALMGTVGYLEYWVQRRGDQAMLLWAVMGCCLAAMTAIVCLLHWRAAAVPVAQA